MVRTSLYLLVAAQLGEQLEGASVRRPAAGHPLQDEKKRSAIALYVGSFSGNLLNHIYLLNNPDILLVLHIGIC